ncbi:MAG: Fe-S protein assembly co-chaperone HscB [Gammaproteobacteria bacterium]|nr:Fe-S protein assembly co-chaperone HscB [Gammaproteobacteria bacterium]
MTEPVPLLAILERNYFQLFELPEQFPLDQSVLNDKYLHLQKVAHPDRYATALARERVMAGQLAAYANEAYHVLKGDLSRAQYLLQLTEGASAQQGTSVTEPAILMEQMELREQLEGISQSQNPLLAIDQFANDITVKTQKLKQEFGESFSRKAFEHAKRIVNQWQFFDRLKQEVDDLAAELEEGN